MLKAMLRLAKSCGDMRGNCWPTTGGKYGSWGKKCVDPGVSGMPWNGNPSGTGAWTELPAPCAALLSADMRQLDAMQARVRQQQRDS